MKVTAPFSRSFMSAIMLLIYGVQRCCCANQSDGIVLHVDPDRLQFFEFDSITLKCLGSLNQWRVMKMHCGKETICGPNRDKITGPCHISHLFELDGGEYWCETDGGVRSSSVNISVTAGPVILVIPALPVTEGEDVTLSCKNRGTPSAEANFYKDGVLQGGNMIIHNVSKSDEGLYKCDVPGVGQSAESWLAVRVSPLPTEEWPPSKDEASKIIIIGILSVLAVLLLLLLGLCLCRKHKGFIYESWQSLRPGCPISETETESGETSEDDPERNRDSWTRSNMIYNFSNKERKLSSFTSNEDSYSHCSSDLNEYYCAVD